MDLDKIEGLLKLLSEHEVRAFQFKDEEIELELKLGAEVVAAPVVASAPMPMMAAPPVAAAAPAAAPAAGDASAADEGLVVIESPMVGTFYRAPSPDAAPFVSEGMTIKAGDPLCIVEAMKLMNEIEAEISGEIVEICIQNGTPVQFGQALFKVRPA